MKPVESSNRPRHLPRLDSVRGLAIVMVFVFHLLGIAYHGQDVLEWRGMFRDVHGLADKSFLNPLSRVERWLVRPGLCSYSFYLWHKAPLLVVRSLADHFHIPPVPYMLIVGPVAFAATFFLSWGLYRLVELGSMSLGKRIAELGLKNIFAADRVASQLNEASPQAKETPVHGSITFSAVGETFNDAIGPVGVADSLTLAAPSE